MHRTDLMRLPAFSVDEKTWEEVVSCVVNREHLVSPTSSLNILAEALYLSKNADVDNSISQLELFSSKLSCCSDMTYRVVSDMNGNKEDLVVDKHLYYLIKAKILSKSVNHLQQARRAFKQHFAFSVNIGKLKKKFHEDSRVVFSFRSANEYCFTDLLNNTITVAPPTKMNDPFDTLLFSWLEYKRKQPESDGEEGPYQRMMNDLYVDASRYFRIRSFVSANRSRLPVSNTLMWSHYASNHSGVCIKYRLSSNFINQRLDNGFYTLQDVIYPEKKDSKIGFYGDSGIRGEEALLYKSREWKYENESRLITYIGDREEDFVGIPLDENSKVEAIYFGLRCPTEVINSIRSLFKSQPNVKFYSMGKDYSNIFHLRSMRI